MNHKLTTILLLFALSVFVVGGAIAQVDPDDPDNDSVEIRIDPDDVEDLAEDAVEATEEVTNLTVNTINEFVEELLIAPDNELVRILLVIGGVLLLFFGWRFYNYVIIFSGALVGASVALGAVGDASSLIEIVALFVGAVIGAILAILLYSVAVFFIGAYIGIVLTTAVAATMDIESISYIVLLIGAILGGIILLAVSHEFVIFLAAIVGAQMMALALGLSAIWTIALFVIGVVVQYLFLRQAGIPYRRRIRMRRFF